MTSFYFGRIPIPSSHVFFASSSNFAFVNLRPVVPGHVLISPIRKINRYSELTDNEAHEIWLTTQKVCHFLEKYYKKSCEIGIQDGLAAGQTIEHLHIHVHPTLDSGEVVPLDSDRKDRTIAEMEEEAKIYREYLEEKH